MAEEFDAAQAKQMQAAIVRRALNAERVLIEKVIRPYELQAVRSDSEMSQMKSRVRSEVNWIIGELQALLDELS